MPLLGTVLGNVAGTVGTIGASVSVSAQTGGSSGTSGIGAVGTGSSSGTSGSSSADGSSSGTSGASGASASAGASGATDTVPSTGGSAAPAQPNPVPANYSVSVWNLTVAEIIFLNVQDPLSTSPSAWLPMTVRYVFADGNAVLTAEPNIVAYTGSYAIGTNLRRRSENYASPYLGPT